MLWQTFYFCVTSFTPTLSAGTIVVPRVLTHFETSGLKLTYLSSNTVYVAFLFLTLLLIQVH